ncbi:phage tail tape measure protein [Corynebacterium silvaticum]|uniref:Phage tail tape measure protein n=1 Tax=Corynebacterium silvaticum TaxID=2320431 RepID=A0A7U5HMX7_9CORY|nr:phage tail tape measure protein [Corynebacterium silvaticum]ARU46724.2 phage tail tape measure protein [Corynebacterium silvaticum]NON70026.1 phage tail tape measure protein [Corynebacterium silvaticum]UWG99965.1 phage tail tape measure protein [Corynebacterium silvaticum]UWH02010.1 phage tail tape measure protein [Corynebacterium silvaticum]UWH04046.1 phage tail tape measure protein [Corynebacterium silvaticum]
MEQAELKLKQARASADAAVASKESAVERARLEASKASDKLADSERKLGENQKFATGVSSDLFSATRRLDDAQEAAAKSTESMSRGMEKFKEKGSHAIGAVSEKLKGLPGLMLGAATAFAGVASIKGAVWDVGKEFESTYNIIRSGTGASGEAFDALKQSLRNVSGTVAAEGGLAEIGATMADLNTRLGVTGAPLEEMTRQFQNLKNLGFDADVTSAASALSAFGVEAGQMPEAMNDLFRVSQATGVSIDSLAGNVVKGGPQLKQFGFSIGESAALVGKLDKAGKDPQKELHATASAVGDLIKKGDEVGAIALSEKLFGVKGAGKFVEAVKTGALSIDDLQGDIGVTQDTINGLAGELETTGQKWQRFRDTAKEALEPVAQAVQDFAKNKLEALIQFIPVAEAFSRRS